MIKVLLVDDHILFRTGIRTALANACSDVSIVGEAGSGRETFELMQSTSADIIILDLILPDMPGVDVASQLRKRYPATKILVLSCDTRAHSIQQLVDVGIDGFISKEESDGRLLSEAIHSIMDGSPYYGKDISTIMYYIYVAQKKQNGAYIFFTAREKEIIQLCHQGLMSKEIAERLNISPRTVEAHKNNIFKKLGINNTLELVKYAMENGIIPTDL
jgi:DNA-binding NarL/FixJ family response regulator